MRHRHIACAALALCTLAACSGDKKANAAGAEIFTFKLDGQSERPNPVNTSALGTARLSFTGGGPITYTVEVTSLSTAAVSAHLHGPASADASAAPLVTFGPLSNVTTGMLVSGTIAASDVAGVSLDSLKSLLRNELSYVNVHTSTYPDGEIRGQARR